MQNFKMLELKNITESFLLKVLRYRVHISLIYAFLLVQTWERFGLLRINHVVVLAFLLWHFGLYLFDRAYDAKMDQLSQKEEAIPLSQQKALLVIAVVLPFISILVLASNHMNIYPYLFYIPIAYLYTYPLPGFKKRVRDLFLLKNLYSSFFIWSFSLFYMLKYYSGNSEIGVEFYLKNFGALLILTTIGEIHWDMRDIETDTVNNVQSLPVVLGLKNCKIVLLATLFFSFFILHIVSISSLIMMSFLILVAGYKTSNLLYHLPPIIALYNFIINK